MTESGKSSERRRVPRVKVDFPVTVHWGRRRYRWRAEEFSEYGILLASIQPEMVGKELQLELLPMPNLSLSLTGIVAYSTERGVGVRFKNVPADQQRILRDYVQAAGIGIAKR